MAPFSDSVRDQYNRPVLGATIHVFTQAGVLATLYTESGGPLANPILVDALGNYSFYANDAKYRREIRLGSRLLEASDIIVGDPPEYVGKPGDPGPAGNVAATLDQLQSAPITNGTMIAAYDGSGSTMTWTLGDFTAQAAERPQDYVQANGVALATGAWVRQSAESIIAKGTRAPAMVGQTLQAFYDGSLDEGKFGIVGDGQAIDNEGLQSFANFMSEATQAGEPYSPAGLTAAALAKRVTFRGRNVRITQPIIVPQRKVDRTNSRLVLSDLTLTIDGDFTAFVPDSAPSTTDPNAEFVAFERAVFFNRDPDNTALCFDPRFLRMYFLMCEWWQQRCYDSTTMYAQEWAFAQCMARNWSGGSWFRSAGAYAVNTSQCKFQFGNGNVFEQNSASAGVVGCTHQGFVAESNGGHFVRWGQVQGSSLIGGYSEKNAVALVNATTLPGGRNRGLTISGVQSDPLPARRADPTAFEFILGAGGGQVTGCHSTGNMIDNRLCHVADVSAHGNQLFDPVNNRLYSKELDGLDNLVPDPTGGYAVVASARINRTTNPNAAPSHALSLPYPIKGMDPRVIVNDSSVPFLVHPQDVANAGAKFSGGMANTPFEQPAASMRTYSCATTGIYIISGG